MKLTVLGATGGVGRQVVRQAVERGDDVTVVVRDPARLGDNRSAVRVVTAGIDDTAALIDAVSGRDAVISAIGPRNRREAGVAIRATRAIIEAMDAVGVRRIAVISASPLDPPSARDGLAIRLIGPLIRRVFADVYTDLRGMERLLESSHLAWTSVRPPRLTNGPYTGRYRTQLGSSLPGGSIISRADVADALLRAVTDDRQIRMPVGVAR